ncbi:hypothetical protein O6H91_10G082200 [Diphasiastrum complanatum]|uniref:Uncharacterized protein n=1 Tax=Diphasiastrum complanatum TaxID=34168 RepID=A0ACC2CIS0_DIPCM|nr:hypothetical protein O6H91_10G082200 [Diphasiastrum complanatum]
MMMRILILEKQGGVITERCYGCGRCIPVCPVRNIGAKNYVRSTEAIIELLRGGEVQAIEIHTGAGHFEAFESLWKRLETALQSLKLIAVSLPDLGDCMTSSLSSMYAIMQPSLRCPNLWQLDGRPMSGDIGKGATMAAVSLAARVASSSNRPPGYLQLAGGTNFYTLAALERAGLFKSLDKRDEVYTTEALVAGIAFGGYARKIVHDCFSTLEKTGPALQLESYPSLLLEAVRQAASLVGPIKSFKFGSRGQIR